MAGASTFMAGAEQAWELPFELSCISSTMYSSPKAGSDFWAIDVLAFGGL